MPSCKFGLKRSPDGHSAQVHCFVHDAEPGTDGMCVVGRAEAVVEDLRAEVQALRELVEHINSGGMVQYGSDGKLEPHR